MTESHDPFVPAAWWHYVAGAVVCTVMAVWAYTAGVNPWLTWWCVGGATLDLVIAAGRIRERRRFRQFGPWVHHLDGRHTCTRHPSAHHLTEVEAARHMKERHSTTWDFLVGNTHKLVNRRERRNAGDLVTKPRTRVEHDGRTTRKVS